MINMLAIVFITRITSLKVYKNLSFFGFLPFNAGKKNESCRSMMVNMYTFINQNKSLENFSKIWKFFEEKSNELKIHWCEQFSVILTLYGGSYYFLSYVNLPSSTSTFQLKNIVYLSNINFDISMYPNILKLQFIKIYTFFGTINVGDFNKYFIYFIVLQP